MTLRTFVLATLASATLTGAVLADDRSFLTPPLYREQARETAALRPASELTTTPSVVAAPAPLSDAAQADDRITLTPPLYREQARTTAILRPASELTTIPAVTPRAAPTRRIVAEAIERTAR